MATSPFSNSSLFASASATQLPVQCSSYALVASAPAPRAEEVESATQMTVEVVVRWGDNIVHVAHIAEGRGFALGDGGDYAMPADLLGAARFELIRMQGASFYATVPATACADVEQDGKTVALAGGATLELASGARVRIAFAGSELSVNIAAVAAGRKYGSGWMLSAMAGSFQHIGVSFLLHAGLVGAMAFFMPKMTAEDAEANDRDQTLMMRRFLDASAEREIEREKEASPGESSASNGGSGQRAAGAEGKMGSTTATASNKSWSKQGPRDNPNPELSRAQEFLAVRTDGIVGLLNSMNIADPNAPHTPWGPESAQGRDALSLNGNIFGPEAGDAAGNGGLSMSGTGEGGGGVAYSMPGLGDVVGPGRGAGCIGDDCRGGISRGHGPQGMREHKVNTPEPRHGTTVVNGHLPADVIQRIVRMNNGRFRMCYENALKSNPTLSGRVATRFVISRDGAVASVQDGGSDLPDQSVVQCVVRSFSNLSFPAPKDGVATVTYPIMFSPGG
jgi:hypothetical protein